MRKPVVSLVLALAATPALPAAAPAGPAVDRLVACADVPGAADRLACFDREVAPLRSSPGAPRTPAAASVVAPAAAAPPAPSPAPTPRPAPPVAGPAVAVVPPLPAAPPAPAAPAAPVAPSAPAVGATADFGSESLPLKDRPKVEDATPAMQAKVTSVRSIAPGEYLVALDNGQTWRHEEARLGNYLSAGDAVTISRATLGAYRLTRDDRDSKTWLRVRRVR